MTNPAPCMQDTRPSPLLRISKPDVLNRVFLLQLARYIASYRRARSGTPGESNRLALEPRNSRTCEFIADSHMGIDSLASRSDFDHSWLSTSRSNGSTRNSPLFLWLTEHQLQAYHDKLLSEDITYDILGDLRKEDLKELVPKVGDRIRFWRALTKLSLASEHSDNDQQSDAATKRSWDAGTSVRGDSSGTTKRVNFFKPDMSAFAVDISSFSNSDEIKLQVIASAQLAADKTYRFHDGFDFYDKGELLHHAIFTKGVSELNILAEKKSSVELSLPPKPRGQLSSRVSSRASSPPSMSTRPTSAEITNNLASFFPGAGKTQLNASVRHSVYVQNRLFMVEDYRQSQRFSKRLSFVAPHEVSAITNLLSESDRRSSLLSVHQLAERAVAEPTSARKSILTSETPQLEEESTETEKNETSPENGAESTEAWDKYFEEDDALFLKELEREEMNPSEWVRGKLIGHGSFGDVYLAIILFSGGFQAVKQVPLLEGDARMRKMADALRHEIMMLRTLEHKNIVQYRGFKSEGEYINIFLEYVPGGSLASMLADVQRLSEPLIKLYIKQCLIGLAYLHSKGIIHRDIKGANVLVGLNGVVKISDFGLSLQEDAARARQSMQGTAFFMAPEVARGRGGVTTKADVWSLGCLIVELFTGQHPYPTLLQVQALWAVGRGNAPEIPQNASPELQEVLGRCFKMDPDERATAEELLALPFFENVKVPDDLPGGSEFAA